MNIIEGNKLIAEFMGGKHNGGSYYNFYEGLQIQGLTEYQLPASWIETDLKYHTSWDWLMSVILKIGEYKYIEDGQSAFNDYAFVRSFGYKTDNGTYLFRINRQQVFEGDTVISAAWFAICDFIKWYNQESK